MPYDCFISYASGDRKLAEELNQKLCGEGFKVWFDRARLHPGFDWYGEIEQGCENSRVLLPVLTPRWKLSDWTKFETYGAEAVIPLIFEGEWLEVATPPLERFQAEKLEFSTAGDRNWTRLYGAVRRALAEPAARKSARVVHLHHRINDHFVGREKELLRIHEELHCQPRAVLTRGRVRAIVAMGGAGKTTLVRHYAEKFWRCYSQILWVDCRLGLEAEFAHIHDLLFPETVALGYCDSDKAARAFEELQKEHTRLLVLDNVDDEESIIRWIPKTGACHTLLTSRFGIWSAAIKTVHLCLLEKAPARVFLQSRSGIEAVGAELAACDKLAEELGYLPLAMEHAAAYISQQGQEFGFSDYLQLYKRAATELLAIRERGSTDYPEPVMITWKSTLATLTPSARAVLSLGSFLASTELPVEMLVAGAERVQELAVRLAHAPPAPLPDPEMFIRAALNDLKRFSVGSIDGRAFSMHRLVQLVVRESLPSSDRVHCWNCAVHILVPYARNHGCRTQLLDRWKPILPHAEALHARWTDLRDVLPSTELAEILRDCYYSQGRYEDALPFAQLVYDEDLRESGETSSPTGDSLSLLGNVHARRKDFVAATESHRAVRKWAAQQFGERHHITLSRTQSLAISLSRTGHAGEAASLFSFVLEAWPLDEITLGAYAYMLQNVLGDLQQARTLYERALGQTPDDTINLNNYAGLCLVLGDLSAAEKSLRAAWRIASRRADRVAARTLFFRAALAYLRKEDSNMFLGQLRSIFESGLSPAPSENVSVMQHLRERLSEDECALLEAVFDAINDRSALERLKHFSKWRETPPVVLEEPWPAEIP